VDGVETIRAHVIGEPGGTADPGDDSKVLMGNSHFGHHPLNGIHNGVITASGTPADFVLALEIFNRIIEFVHFLSLQKFRDCIFQFLHRKWQAFYFVVLVVGKTGEFVTQIGDKLTQVDFTNQDFFKPPEYFPGIGR